MESFDHAAPNVVRANLRKPLSEPYQYYSWKFAASVVLVSSALLAVGLSVDRPMLYDLAIFAGYLLFQVVVRLSIEVLWRLPTFRKYRVAISKWAFADRCEGMPPLGLLNPLEWLSRKRMRKSFTEPNLWTHHTDKLSEVFDNPMYFSESYMRDS